MNLHTAIKVSVYDYLGQNHTTVPYRTRTRICALRIPQGNAQVGPIEAKMVYDWENKEELCYRLYIEEKKSLEEIMEFMKEHHKFAPRYVPTVGVTVTLP